MAVSNSSGPGGSDWTVEVVSANGGPIRTLQGLDLAAQQRVTLVQLDTCQDDTYTFTVTDGTGFGVDAILI
jgi:hypothetical protein